MTNTDQASAAASGATVAMGGVEHPISAIPAVNQAVLLQRALNHIFSNEKAAFVKGRRDKAQKEAEEAGQTFDAEAWNAANEDALEDEFVNAKTDLILNGVLGQRAAGVPKQTRLERMVRAIVRTAIENHPNVKSGAVKVPTKNQKGSGEWWDKMIEKTLSDPDTKARAYAKAEEEIKAEDARNAAMAEGLGLAL